MTGLNNTSSYIIENFAPDGLIWVAEPGTDFFDYDEWVYFGQMYQSGGVIGTEHETQLSPIRPVSSRSSYIEVSGNTSMVNVSITFPLVRRNEEKYREYRAELDAGFGLLFAMMLHHDGAVHHFNQFKLRSLYATGIERGCQIEANLDVDALDDDGAYYTVRTLPLLQSTP